MVTTVLNRALESNKMLKNTFMLLAATLGFSALAAFGAMAAGIAVLNPWLVLGVYIAILVALHFKQNSALAIPICFALTGWLGFTLGPILAAVIAVNSMVVINALALTTLMFVGLSFYAIASKKDFSFLGGFLTVGILVAFVAGLAAMFFQIPLLGLAVSFAFVLLSSGVILWQISNIIHGGETNYVMATVTLYVSIYNIFVSLLSIFGSND